MVFENCNGLKDSYDNLLPFATFKLKYVKDRTKSWETINLPLTKKGKNCIQNVEFYEDVQEKYDIELWASCDSKKTAAGSFNGKIYLSVLPKP